MRLRPELAPQRGDQTDVLGLGAGEQQGVEAQHDRLVVVLARAGFQHGLNALMQPAERLAVGSGVVQPAAQAERQGHFQQVAAGMGGEPGLQVRIDPVGEAEPGAAMHAAAFLGGDHVAGHFGLDLVAAEQQIVRGAVLQAGKGDGEAAGALQHGGAHQVEDRDQGVLSAQPKLKLFASAGRGHGGSASAMIRGISAAIRPSNRSAADGLASGWRRSFSRLSSTP